MQSWIVATRLVWIPAALLAAGFSVTPLASQEPERATGTLQLIWGDPAVPGDSVRHRFSILTDGGATIPLVLEGGVLPEGTDAFSLVRRRVTADVVRERVSPRDAGARVLRLRETGGADGMLAGSRPYVTILCKFPDFAAFEPTTAAELAARLDAYPGVAHYWREVSDGRLDVKGPVVGWYVLPEPKESYVTGDGSSPNLTRLAADCAGAADQDVVFPDHAGVNFVFNTDIGCCLWGGQSGMALDGVARSYGTTWLAGDVAHWMGGFTHEVGHSFGLPHSSGPYGLVYDSWFDVMSSAGWYVTPGGEFEIGTHTNIYHKSQLGWVPAERRFEAMPGTQTILLAPTARPATDGYLLARVATPGFDPWEYYLLEARGGSGYDAPFPVSGVAIHRVGGGGASASNAVDMDGNGLVSDAGSILEPGEWFVDAANHLRISVDGRQGDAFRVTIRQGDYPRLVVDTTTRVYAATAGVPVLWLDSTQVGLPGAEAGSEWSAGISFGPGIELLSQAGRDGEWLRWSVDSRAFPTGPQQGTLRVTHGSLTAFVPIRLIVGAGEGLVAGTMRPVVSDSGVVGVPTPGGAFLQLSGPSADSATWTASSDASWISLTAPAGVGSATVTWDRVLDGMAPGVYEDSVRVDVPGATGSPVWIRERFRVLERPSLAVTRGSSSARAPQGGLPVRDSVRIEMSGRFATGGVWSPLTAWDGHVRLAMPYPRPGDGWFHFTREPGDRAPGIHVTRFGVTLPKSPQDTVLLVDTLIVEAAPPAVRAYPTHRAAAVIGASAFSRDSVYVQPEGPGASTAAWEARFPAGRLHAHSYSGASDPARGTGPGWLFYVRVLSDRATGLHVDTIRIGFLSGNGEPALLVDSLTVHGGPTLAVGAPTGGARVRAGVGEGVPDSVTLTIEGVEAEGVPWAASAKAAWIALEATEGIGNARLRWTRHPAGLEAGVHVDTIRVEAAAAGSPALVVDSLVVVGAFAIAADPIRPTAVMGAPYADSLVADGVLETVVWTVSAGALPPGLALDSLSGRVTGIPQAAGSFGWTVAARSGDESAAAALTTVVAKPVLAADDVIDALLAGRPLGADDARFLDLAGNRNGRLDVGDVAAWLADPESTLTAEQRAAARRRFEGGR